MSRPIRIEYPRVAYHVVSRGNFGNKIYKDNKDYENFFKFTGGYIRKI